MRQRIDESSDDFVSRLNNQANLCKFRERDERIVEQLTYGTKHAEVQKALLVQDETYTLAKALEACRIYDASEGHQRAFREIQGGEVTVPVHAVQQRGPPPALGELCYNCGESRHRSSQGCPARTSTCISCGTIGHWAKAKACPRKQPSRTTPDLAIDPSPVTDPPTVDGKEDGAAAAAAMVRIPVMTVKV